MSWQSLASRFWSGNGRWQENVLMAHADALIGRGSTRAPLRRAYTKPGEDDLDALLRLSERIERAMPPVTPSEQYVAQLRRRLLESDPQEALSLWSASASFRAHPIGRRYRRATLTAGVVILATRSVYDALGSRRNRRTVTA